MSKYSNTAYKDKQAKKTKKNKPTVEACANCIGKITLHQKITPITPEFLRIMMCREKLYSQSQYHKISKEVKDILGRGGFTVIRMLRVDKSKVSEWWSCVVYTHYIYEWFASLDQERFVNYINSKEKYKKMYDEKGLDEELLFLIFRNRFFKWVDRDGETKKSTHKCMIAVHTMRKKIHHTINKQMRENLDLQKILDINNSEKKSKNVNNIDKNDKKFAFTGHYYHKKFSEFLDQEYEKLIGKGIFKFPSVEESQEIFNKIYQKEAQEDIDFRNFVSKEKEKLIGKGIFKFPSVEEFKEIFDINNSEKKSKNVNNIDKNKNNNNNIGGLISNLVPTFFKKISKTLMFYKETILNSNRNLKKKRITYLGGYFWGRYKVSETFKITRKKCNEYKQSTNYEAVKLKQVSKAVKVLEIWCECENIQVKERYLHKCKDGREIWILRPCSSKNVDTSMKAKRYIFKMLALIFRSYRKEFWELLEYLGVERIKTIRNRISRDFTQNVSKEDWYKMIMKVYHYLIYRVDEHVPTTNPFNVYY
ncbi:hypothetical protein [Romboutsia sp.]|uniref:hypothetical protein n=1 Tax=Romboutsia sp. TaxID=1965302 RepID=UPI003F407AAD